MAENSKIEWCDHTFNPWIGCTKVSPACDHCYAEAFVSGRMGKPQLWQGERQRTAENNWKLPLRWSRKAEREGRRARVFCASLADVFDNQVPDAWREDLFNLIRETPALDWLLLTKRPQNIARMMPRGRTFLNIWLGTTVENQAEAERRIPHLLMVPTARRFLSCEPLLEAVYLRNVRMKPGTIASCDPRHDHVDTLHPYAPERLDWVICGGESGSGRRSMDLAWARSLRDQCAAASVPFFMKQIDKVTAVPDDLLIREFPPA